MAESRRRRKAAKATIYFQAVPEEKAGKRRLHIDITADDLEPEVFRLQSNGASTVSENGHTWVIMTCPEGNEFCVSPASG